MGKYCIRQLIVMIEFAFYFYPRTQRKQLEEIFKLLETDKDKFGVTTMDDLQAQMQLYTRS